MGIWVYEHAWGDGAAVGRGTRSQKYKKNGSRAQREKSEAAALRGHGTEAADKYRHGSSRGLQFKTVCGRRKGPESLAFGGCVYKRLCFRDVKPDDGQESRQR